MKLMLCDGDSWTSGDIINPELELAGKEHPNVNDPSNDDYRLPKVWPHKLGKLLNVETLNIAMAGSSNDAIVRRTMRKVKELLLDYKPEDLFVIIGWSSPERKDFYYTGEWESWETIYPVQNYQLIPDKDIDTFYKIYQEKFWNEPEYVERYMQQNLLLHYFLEEHDVRHLFFDAFYETKGKGSMFNSLNIDEIVMKSGHETKGHYTLTEYFLKLKKQFFLEESFRNVIMDINNKLFGDDFHPTEEGHEVWSRYLYDEIV